MPTIFDNLAAESQLGTALRQYFTDSYTTWTLPRGTSTYADGLTRRHHRGQGSRVGFCAGGSLRLVGMVAPSDSQAILNSLQSEIAEDASWEHRSTTAARPWSRRSAWSGTCALSSCVGCRPRALLQETLQLMKRQLESGRVQIRVFH